MAFSAAQEADILLQVTNPYYRRPSHGERMDGMPFRKQPTEAVKPQRPILYPKRDTAGNWRKVNPVLREREMGLDYENAVIKIGDGVHGWNDLPEFTGTDYDPFRSYPVDGVSYKESDTDAH